MSAPFVVIDVVAVLLAALPSLLALVVPDSVLVPTAVGVPEIVQVILAPATTLVGGVGEHDVLRPGGRPETAQVADAAVSAGARALVQVNVPL